MVEEYFIECKAKFHTKAEALVFGKEMFANFEDVKLHIHRHGDKGDNQPCELIKLKGIK